MDHKLELRHSCIYIVHHAGSLKPQYVLILLSSTGGGGGGGSNARSGGGGAKIDSMLPYYVAFPVIE